MPGAHLDFKIMRCYPDVGGVDCWLGSYWENQYPWSQWWTGWHLPGPRNAPVPLTWSWPNPNWVFIGFERWEYFRHFPHSRLMEAMYQDPNPSTVHIAPIPEGHYYITYLQGGELGHSVWYPIPLEEPDPEELYLKGTKGKGKGKGQGPGDQGKGKGLLMGAKGEGKHQGHKGKGKDEGSKGKGT